MEQTAKPDPPGWNYNPSEWGDRFPIIALAATGLGVALYLGLYQLQVVHGVWEPFFGAGSEVILRHTPLSQAVPDALIGAFFYLLELVFSLIGGRDRWRTRPWVVLRRGSSVWAWGSAGCC